MTNIAVIGKMGEIEYAHVMDSDYMSVDPGETTGITLWNDTGKPVTYNELDIESYHRLLDLCESDPRGMKRIIIEEFRLYQNKALQQSGSKLVTVQVIGITKRANRRICLEPVIEVRADNKEIAAKWSGIKVPKGHMPDWMSSYLIGYWWLHHVAKVIPARVLEQT